MVEKLGRKMTEAEEARFWHQLNEEERVRKEERHVRDVEQARLRSAEAVAERDLQLEQLAERRRIEAEEAARDLAELKAKWEAADAKAAADERAAADRATRIAADVKAFNAKKRAQQDAEREAERLFDLRLVAEAVRRNEEEEEKERLIREAKRQGDEEYRKHLAFLAHKQQQENGELDRLVNEYNEREFQKRDDVRQREEAARQALMREVMANNRAQLEEKARAKVAAEEERVRERERFEADKRAMGEAAARAAAAQRAAVYLRKAELEAQVRAKEERKQAERAAQQAEVDQARHVEEQYRLMLEQEKLRAKAPQDFRRKKNNWCARAARGPLLCAGGAHGPGLRETSRCSTDVFSVLLPNAAGTTERRAKGLELGESVSRCRRSFFRRRRLRGHVARRAADDDVPSPSSLLRSWLPPARRDD